jgi:preprotein translocase subunit Sss1
MGFKGILSSMVSTLRLTKKTTFEEFKLYLKLVMIGLGVVGGIGFVVKIIASFLALGGR